MAVNGAHLLDYKHRMPLNRVDTFSISGNVRVHAIGYIPNSVSTFVAQLPDKLHVVFCKNVFKYRFVFF